jgi:hypothetical protein
MGNLIKKPQELNLQAKLKILLYGQAGVGKTTLSLSAPKPLLIDCDGGVHRVNFGHVADTVQVETFDDVLNVLKEDLRPYESIIIDTGGKLLDFMAEYIIKRNSKMGKANGTLTLQGYGERKAEFSNFCKKISLLNKHLIFVAHRQTQQEGDDFRYVPLFGGSNYDALVTELDIVGYMEAQGKKRTITFDPTSRNDGKNTCNLPSIVEVPTVVDDKGNAIDNIFLADKVIKVYIDRLHQNMELKKEYDDLIEFVSNELSAIDNVTAYNDFMGKVPELKHVGSSMLKAKELLLKRAKELNFTYNKELKQYENI